MHQQSWIIYKYIIAKYQYKQSAPSMQEEQVSGPKQQQFYMHSEVHPHSQRTLLRRYHCYDKHNNNHYQAIAIVNHNSVEIYRNTGTRVIYETAHLFMANITVMEVLPVKGSHSDVLFVADEQGRWLFWTPEEGALAGSNLVKNMDLQVPLYQRVPAQDKQPQFSGITANFNSFQTEAVLFFTVGTKIVVFRVRWSRGRIVMVNAPSEITCPYMDVNYMSVVSGKQAYIGIIEQREQKTFLRLHRAVSQHFECILSLQKTNLASFFTNPDPFSSSSTNQFEELVTVTNNELSIYNLKTQQVFCTFQVTEVGHICALDSDLYIYVGELASQMIVFNRKHYKNYGGFMLENFVCMGIASAGKLNDGGHLIAVLDQGHTLQFIALYEQQWKSIKSIPSTSSIFSIECIESPHQTLIVRGCQSSYQVGLLRQPETCPLFKQSSVSSPVLAIFPLLQGKSIILCTLQSNTVLNFNTESNTYELSFEFESGSIVEVLGKYVIMEKQIYEVDLNKNNIRELWVEKNGIVSAAFDGKFIGVLLMDGYYKFYNVDTKEVDRIRKGCSEMYLHRFVHNQTLLCSNLSQPGQLTLVPVFKQDSIVTLPHLDIISDLLSFDEYLVVSYCNKCVVEVYEFNCSNIRSSALTAVHTVEGSSQPLLLVKWAQGVLAYGSREAYLIKIIPNNRQEKISHSQIEFDSFKDVASVVYLEFVNKFAVTHPDAVCVYELPQPSPAHFSSFKPLADIVDASPPFVTHQSPINTYIAQPYQIVLRHSNTAQLIKKQSHGLKQVCCIQNLQAGLLVCGVNDMDVVELFIFKWDDLSIIMNESLGNRVEKKMPTAAKNKYSEGNEFFIRDQNSVTLYTLRAEDAHSSSYIPQSYTLKQIFSSKISLQGYTLAVQPSVSMVMASDPLRYTVVYDYRLGKLVSLCRYQSLNTINDVEFIDEAVVVADCVGGVEIVQFGFDQGEGLKTSMTEVGRLNIGAQVTCMSKNKKNGSVTYGTLSGFIGKVQTLSAAQFNLLKKVEHEMINKLAQNRNELRYQQWKSRFSLDDKIIDAFLIQKYIHLQKQKQTKLKNNDTNNMSMNMNKEKTDGFEELCQIWKSIKMR